MAPTPTPTPGLLQGLLKPEAPVLTTHPGGACMLFPSVWEGLAAPPVSGAGAGAGGPSGFRELALGR